MKLAILLNVMLLLTGDQINCVLLTAVMRVFLQLKSVSKKSELERTKRAAKAVALILPLLGITWILGVLAVNASTKWFIYLFSIFNSLQVSLP